MGCNVGTRDRSAEARAADADRTLEFDERCTGEYTEIAGRPILCERLPVDADVFVDQILLQNFYIVISHAS